MKKCTKCAEWEWPSQFAEGLCLRCRNDILFVQRVEDILAANNVRQFRITV